MNNNKNSKSIFYIFVILFFGWVVSELFWVNEPDLIINPNEITGFQIGNIDPLGALSGFLNTNLFGGNPLWAIILVFAMVFSVAFVLIKKIHIFKDESSKGPAIVFSLAVSLLTVFATDIVSFIAALAVSFVYIIVFVAIILVVWAAYVGTHKTVSQDIGELARIGASRVNSQQAYYQAAKSYETARQEYDALRNLRNQVYQQNTEQANALLNEVNNMTNQQIMQDQELANTLGEAERILRRL